MAITTKQQRQQRRSEALKDADGVQIPGAVTKKGLKQLAADALCDLPGGNAPDCTRRYAQTQTFSSCGKRQVVPVGNSADRDNDGVPCESLAARTEEDAMRAAAVLLLALYIVKRQRCNGGFVGDGDTIRVLKETDGSLFASPALTHRGVPRPWGPSSTVF